MRQNKHITPLTILPIAAVTVILLLSACASMGRPDGGPRDTYPPLFVRSNPMPGELNVDGQKISVYFDENIQLDDPMNKVIVSPAQKMSPVVTSNGHRVSVELRDTLLPNTTYTIDFSDAIKDLNEGNVLDGFAIDFSTGTDLDSLRISGMVFQASNLEPAQGMLVGAYLDGTDSAIATRPFDRVTKTNQLGQFTLRGLKAGSYRLYALNDNNRDNRWDCSEDVAFYGPLVTPTAERITHTDTLRSATGAIDSVVTHAYTRFRPNDLLLTWFNEDYRPQYLKEYNRPDARRLSLILGAPTDSLPRLRLLNGRRASESIDAWALLTGNEAGDTIEYWITDPEIVKQDTMLVEAIYQRVDSLDRLVWKTDTLKLNLRSTGKKNSKKTTKAAETAEDRDSISPKIELLDISLPPSPAQDLNRPLSLRAATPLSRIDSAGIHLEMMEDTLWVEAPKPVRFSTKSERNPFLLEAPYDWLPGRKYRLTVDSLAISDIYGLHNKPLKYEFTTREEGDYSTLYFILPGLREKAVVELLNGNDAVVARTPVVNGGAELSYLNPGTYYARLFIDSDANGVWSTGRLLDGVQPEEVYYYPRQLTLKKNWDVEQTWDIYDTAVDLQKPATIKKNKPPRRPGDPLPEKEKTDEEDEEEFDNFDNFSPNPYNTNNGSTYNPNNINRLR